MVDEADVCVIGSGAGGAPVALRVAEAGRRVVVLEKGPWLGEGDFTKDEIAECRRHRHLPRPADEPHLVELPSSGGGFELIDSRADSSWNLWNGSLVGGATNLMSGYFYRKKPLDFAQALELGPVEGAEVADWPIAYADLEPFYAEAEREVGVSGRVVSHPLADRRSTPDFPFPALDEHPVSRWVEQAASALGLHPFAVPRAILSRPHGGRGSCSYSGFCADYGCGTGAKGSARAALLTRAVATGNCHIRARAAVTRIDSDHRGRATAAEYVDEAGQRQRVRAKVFVLACQPIETARLLLLSTGPRHPRGLGNQSGLVGRHLHFAMTTSGQGELCLDELGRAQASSLSSREPWVNRAVQDHYVIADRSLGRRVKGGTVHFLLAHPNPIEAAAGLGREASGPVFGEGLVRRIRRYFKATCTVVFEAFADWLPTADTRVTLDPELRDRRGLPVARVRIRPHPQSEAASEYLAGVGAKVLERMGARDIRVDEPGPSTNLAGGTCRFGRDPRSSVLDSDCRSHHVDNLFVTDASFMPTGGSAPHTFTIYANAFRVAHKVVSSLG